MSYYNIQFANKQEDFADVKYGLSQGGPGFWVLPNGIAGDIETIAIIRKFARATLHKCKSNGGDDRAYRLYTMYDPTGAGVWVDAGISGTIKE